MARILVLEGDTFARNLYCEYLRAEGFDVHAEPDTALALAALARRAADVIVAKVGTGEPYAQALLGEARRRAPRVELIALIERGSPDAAARALRDGAHDYLLKPVTRPALALAVRRCLELARLGAERPQLARELTLYRHCQALTFAGGPEGVAERIAHALTEHAGAHAAVVLAPGEHGVREAIARVGLAREVALKVAASFGETTRRGRPAAVRELGEPLQVDVPARWTVLLYGVKETRTSGPLREELALLARWGATAAELLGRYAEAGAAESMDPLSGLYEARYLERVLDEEVARVGEGGPPLAVLLVNVDGFRGVNDLHGHLTGGRVLVEASRVLERCVREVDVIARVGADEFAVVLLHTDAAGARGAAERIRRAFESHLFLVREGLDLRLTVSVGVAACPAHGRSAGVLMRAAERAVEQAKADAKNRVALADP